METKSKPQGQTSLGFFEIIRESFNDTRRNWKVISPILVLVFIQFSISDFAQEYLLAPFIKDLVSQLAQHASMVQDFSYTIDKIIYTRALRDLRGIVLIKLSCMASSFFVTLILLTSIITPSSAAHTAKVLDTKELNLVFLKSIKRALVTSFYVILLTFGIVSLYFISMTITTVLTLNSWSFFFLGVISLSIPVCYVYVSTLWIASMVVSVLEEGFSGVKAIGRAAYLMKGKRLQASLMMVLFVVAYGVAGIVVYLTRDNLSISTQMAIRTPFLNGLLTLLTLFVFAVYTVFYREWKRCDDEKEGKGFYFPIVAGDA